MISSVEIKNFKCLRDVRIGLERFTIFVGPNASGKSSILQALDLLCRAFRSKDNREGSSIEEGMSRGSQGPVEFLAKYGHDSIRYRTRTLLPRAEPKREPWSGVGRGVLTEPWKDWTRWMPEQGGSWPYSVLLHLEPSKLVEPQPVPLNPPVMAPDGSGLHATLASMALNDPDSWQALQENLRRIVPSIRRLRHTREVPAALLFDTVGADSVPATQMSEGTLLVLGLLTALHAVGRTSLILLDDLDRGLHPRAQKELILLLRGLLESRPTLQLLATSHSPYMLDCMEPGEIRMTDLEEERGTVCEPLASHPKFSKWKDEMTPGEMWSLFGEKWLVEGAAP